MKEESHEASTTRTRNIGIIAHIDAGKTTTTERMLYYSGHTRSLGSVDEGSTVTDFLPAERARGITIQSAAITFYWPPNQAPALSGDVSDAKVSHTINLIDTPGHSDFTFEVTRSLRVLDGAVCILDGVAGVEAQTEKVWYQAGNYGVPRIIYVNKLDREGAAFGRAVKEIASKLNVWPAVCHLPWFENGKGRFKGLLDVVNQVGLEWEVGGDGKTIIAVSLAELERKEPGLAREGRKAREALIELIAEHDDVLIEQWDAQGMDHQAVRPSDITASLRRCLLDRSSPVVPVFAGASFRNIGVQPVLDAVNELLPCPQEAPDPEIKAGELTLSMTKLVNGFDFASPSTGIGKKGAKPSPQVSSKALEACALAFKVVNDAKRGVLVYVRVYQGNLKQGSLIYNTDLQVSERIPRLLKMLASDSQEVSSISAGQIGVITGLKHARTGDTLITYTGMNAKIGPPAPVNQLQLRPIEVPPPVFFASVEPHSLGEEKNVKAALDILLREDPSLHVTMDEESGQTHLSGMGELHLEIARDRLLQDLKAKAEVGKIEIGYRETLVSSSVFEDALSEREIAGKFGKAGCSALAEPLPLGSEASDLLTGSDLTVLIEGNIVKIELVAPGKLADKLPPHLSRTELLRSLQNGASAALSRGPSFQFQVHGVQITLRVDVATQTFGSDTTPAALVSAARQATRKALRAACRVSPSTIMEPVMNVVIQVDEKSMGTVIHDISSARGGQIISTEDDDIAGLGLVRPPSNDDPIDLRKVYAPPDPFDAPSGAGGGQVQNQTGNRVRTIVARIPLREMVGYLKHLRSQTAGRGTFVMSVDKFEKMSTQRAKLVLKELRGM